MKYFYAALIVLAVAAVLTLAVCLCVQLRRRWACRKVLELAAGVKERMLDDALAPFGFAYDREWDMIISCMYPWQREMGYCREYDEAAPSMNMVFECEPVYFEYDGRCWLLEVWKGQYGCTTGAEVGLYVTGRPSEGRPEKLFYECAGDEDRLCMQFTLYKNGKVIMERSGLHWWLTGFLVGEYSRPRELAMAVSICFPTMAMRDAFYGGLLRAGYKPSDITVEACRVSFFFITPCTEQPHKFGKCYMRRICRRNRRNCRLFLRVTRKFTCVLDRISYLGFCFPILYRRIIRIGMKCTPARLRRSRRGGY